MKHWSVVVKVEKRKVSSRIILYAAWFLRKVSDFLYESFKKRDAEINEKSYKGYPEEWAKKIAEAGEITWMEFSSSSYKSKHEKNADYSESVFNRNITERKDRSDLYDGEKKYLNRDVQNSDNVLNGKTSFRRVFNRQTKIWEKVEKDSKTKWISKDSKTRWVSNSLPKSHKTLTTAVKAKAENWQNRLESHSFIQNNGAKKRESREIFSENKIEKSKTDLLKTYVYSKADSFVEKLGKSIKQKRESLFEEKNRKKNKQNSDRFNLKNDMPVYLKNTNKESKKESKKESENKKPDNKEIFGEKEAVIQEIFTDSNLIYSLSDSKKSRRTVTEKKSKKYVSGETGLDFTDKITEKKTDNLWPDLDLSLQQNRSQDAVFYLEQKERLFILQNEQKGSLWNVSRF